MNLGVLAPSPDRAPDSLAVGIAQPLRGDLEALLGADRVLARPGDLIKYASDASPYRKLPRAVVMAKEPGAVAKVLAFGRRAGIPVTFRAGGTSLNGQGQTDGILVDVRRHFGGIAVLEDGAAVRVGTGTILGHVNRVLAPLGRRRGPAPTPPRPPPPPSSLPRSRSSPRASARSVTRSAPMPTSPPASGASSRSR